MVTRADSLKHLAEMCQLYTQLAQAADAKYNGICLHLVSHGSLNTDRLHCNACALRQTSKSSIWSNQPSAL